MRKILFALVLFLAYSGSALAQESTSVLFVPLIGITSVPSPFALPQGAGSVTYNYAVKNFLPEIPLTDIVVVDDKCSTVVFIEGDDNTNTKLDYDETWRYSCTTKLAITTQSTATVTARINNLTATHTAYATVVVGSNNPPPLVSIVNITKVAEGGDITFTYKVNNPGEVPLNSVTVTDNKCKKISSRLGDTNGNNLLDIHEVWVYTCSTHLIETTVNTATVTAFANGLKAVGEATITVVLDSPGFPETGFNLEPKTSIWLGLLGVLLSLIVIYILIKKKR